MCPIIPWKNVVVLIRDFNNYLAYIEGVSESVIEDDRGGDEASGRRFTGNWVRQRLIAHSSDAHLLTYAGIELLLWCFAEDHSPVRYEGTMRLREIIEAQSHLHRMAAALDLEPQDAERWQEVSGPGIPDWTHSP